MKINIVLFILLALFYAGCKSNPEESGHNDSESNLVELIGEEDSHEHEEVKIQLTAYSDDFEVYAEADPFVIGKSSNVLAHFSILPSFKALEKGRITLTIVIAGREVKQILEEPDRKGIYSFDIEPLMQGSGSLSFDILLDGENYRIECPGIVVYQDKEAADHAAEEDKIHAEGATTFTKEQSWKIDFATEPALEETFGQVIRSSALVKSAQDDEYVIVARTSGIVNLNEGSLLEGLDVKSGESLFSISGNSMAGNNSEVRFMEASNNYEKAKADYTRLKALAEEKIVSEKELLEAENAYNNARIAFEALEKNFSASGQMVSSPITGFIQHVFITNGQYVEEGQSIISVSRNKKLLLKADVQQKYAPILDRIYDATIHLLQDNKFYTMEELGGKILSYGTTTNSDNYLIPVYLQINSTEQIVPGGFVEVYFKTRSNKDLVTVPNSALLEQQGNFSVYVQLTPEIFELRHVTIGMTDGLRTEIKEGIQPGERVVTKGAIFIKLAKSTGTLDAHSGHVH